MSRNSFRAILRKIFTVEQIGYLKHAYKIVRLISKALAQGNPLACFGVVGTSIGCSNEVDVDYSVHILR